VSTKNSARSTSDMAHLKALIVLKSIVLGRLFQTLITVHTKKWLLVVLVQLGLYNL